MTCIELSNKSLSEYMDAFDIISKNYRYLFTVETTGYIVKIGGEEGMKLSFGDTSLEGYKGKVRTANYVIQKTLSGNQYNLIVRLKLARKT